MAQVVTKAMNGEMITAAFKQQFHDSFEIACQQKQSVLEGLVTSRGQIQGSSFTINDMGKLEMKQRGFDKRFSDTELAVPEAGTRLAYMEDYDLFVPIEPFDLPKLSAAPDSPYMQLMLAAANRAKDDLIYRQLTATIMRKTETADQMTGVGAAVAPGKGAYIPTGMEAGQILGTTTQRLAVAKKSLIQLRALFRKNFADDEQVNVLYNSYMLTDILNDPDLTNADYMAVQMLQAGDLAGKWLGLNWIPYERLNLLDDTGAPYDPAGTAKLAGYQTVAFTNSALHFGTGINYSTDIQTRADLRNIKQLSAQMSFGAGRANEKKVVQINFGIPIAP